jgi:hypothetical protein
MTINDSVFQLEKSVSTIHTVQAHKPTVLFDLHEVSGEAFSSQREHTGKAFHNINLLFFSFFVVHFGVFLFGSIASLILQIIIHQSQ